MEILNEPQSYVEKIIKKYDTEYFLSLKIKNSKKLIIKFDYNVYNYNVYSRKYFKKKALKYKLKYINLKKSLNKS